MKACFRKRKACKIKFDNKPDLHGGKNKKCDGSVFDSCDPVVDEATEAFVSASFPVLEVELPFRDALCFQGGAQIS